MRAHAQVEDHIGRLKDLGLRRFPFTGFAANEAWLQTVCRAADLVAWSQLLCLTGPLARALPKRHRRVTWHAPARIITTARRCIIRILDAWPTAKGMLASYRSIAALTWLRPELAEIRRSQEKSIRHACTSNQHPRNRRRPHPRWHRDC